MAFNQQILTNSTLEVQTALGSDITITAISNANPAVFTASNSLTNGDLVVLKSIVGMEKLNTQVVRVTSATASAFSAEGLDTTDTSVWGTYTSGGVGNEVTTLSKFTNVTGLSIPTAQPDQIDITTIDVSIRQIDYGHDGALNGTITVFADPLQTAMAEIIEATRDGTARAFRLTTRTGNVWIWNATRVSGGAGLQANVGQAGTDTINMTLPDIAQAFAS